MKVYFERICCVVGAAGDEQHNKFGARYITAR